MFVPLRLRRRAALVAALALVAACDGTTEPRVLGDLLVVSGDGQSARVGQKLPAPLVVKVIDDGGEGISGVHIRWEFIIGQGTLSSARTVTGKNGETSVEATPTVSGQSAVYATIDEPIIDLYQVVFVMDGT